VVLESFCSNRFRLWIDVGGGLGFSFKSFYEKVIIKLACRNPRKIPHERLYELDKKLFRINIYIEGLEEDTETRSEEGGDDDDEINDDEADDLAMN
jgi:hypothetical protein